MPAVRLQRNQPAVHNASRCRHTTRSEEDTMTRQVLTLDAIAAAIAATLALFHFSFIFSQAFSIIFFEFQMLMISSTSPEPIISAMSSITHIRHARAQRRAISLERCHDYRFIM